MTGQELVEVRVPREWLWMEVFLKGGAKVRVAVEKFSTDRPESPHGQPDYVVLDRVRRCDEQAALHRS